MNELNREMADILEVDSVSDTDQLDSFENWDSLAILTLLSYIDSHYNIQLFGNDIKDATTLSDIKEIIDAKKQ